MPTLNEQAADLLDAAAAEVDKGWCRHITEDTNGNVCAVGAMYRATRQLQLQSWGQESPTLLAHDELHAVMAEQFNMVGSHTSLSQFNDNCATSGDEVATCMRKAAVNLRTAT